MDQSLLGTLVWLGAVSMLVVMTTEGSEAVVGLLRMLKWALPFAVLVFCLYVLLASPSGETIWNWGPVAINREGLTTGGRLSLRFVTFVALARTVSTILTPTGLAVGVTRLLWPLKALGVGIESVYYLVFFIARMAPVLTEEAQIIQFGQRSRGLTVATSWYRRVTGSAALIVPIFAAAMRRSERLSLALTSRGFNPSRIPEVVTAQRFGALDWLILSAIVIGWIAWFFLRLL
jgi:energy-coupling factor transporter transmembrane protein EcfT